MANVGECLAIAEQITPGDRDSWYGAWSGFASRLGRARRRGAASRTPRQRARRLPARRRVLPAGVLLPPRGSRCSGAAPRLRGECQRVPLRARAISTIPRVRLTGALSGYLFAPSGTEGPRPTILHIDGYDGTAEELYASMYPALDRGYVVRRDRRPGPGRDALRAAGADAPGLGERRARDVRRPRREPEVDPERITLVGRSFGGVIAPRGAAGEHRLAALIVDPGQFDMVAAP